MLTANSVEGIPSALLSRMAVYDVPPPTPEQAAGIGQRIYAGLLHELKLRDLDPELGDGVCEKLAEISPREMRKVLLDALGFAVADGRTALLPEDIRIRSEAGKRKIGF